MPRLKFGAFLAPHHPLGEHPTLMFQRDLGARAAPRPSSASTSSGAASTTPRVGDDRLARDVPRRGRRAHARASCSAPAWSSLPYHHPFNVAQRMVQLDHMTQGPGDVRHRARRPARPTRARSASTRCVLRDRQDEALGVIIRLLAARTASPTRATGSSCTTPQLQILPVQERMPMATASSISPSGMQIAGKYGIGVLSIASNSTEGTAALPTQWGFAEEAAREARLDRRPQELARADGVAPRRDARAGAAARPCTGCSAGTTSTTWTCSGGPAPCASRIRGSCSSQVAGGGAAAPARP